MQETARNAIQEHLPAAILFNLMSLNYVWGDAIMGVILTAWVRPKDTVLPCCILAAGRTASALDGLLSLSLAPKEFLGVRLFEDRDRAVAFLTEQMMKKQL